MVLDKVLSMFGLMTIAEHDLEIAINKRILVESKKENLRLRAQNACLIKEVEVFNKMCGERTLRVETLEGQLCLAQDVMKMSIVK